MPIIIDVKLKQSSAMNAMAKLNNAISAVNKNAQALNATLAQTATLAQAVGQAMGGSRGGGVRAGGGARAIAKPPIDPWSRYVNNRLQNQAFRAQFQSQYGKKSNPVLNAVMSSRLGFSASGGFSAMPLVSALAKLGPMGMVAAAGLAAVAGATKMAVEALDKWTQSMVLGGGSPGQAAAASAVGNALGLGPGGIANVGKNLMDGFGPIAAAQAGVNPFGGPFGDNNYNGKGLDIADYINRQFSGKGPAGFEQARRYAEKANEPGLANAALIDRSTYQRLKGVGGGSYEGSKAMSNIKAEWEILSAKAEKMAVRLAGPILEKLPKVFDALSQVFDYIAKAVENIFGPSMDAVKAVWKQLAIAWEWVQGMYDKMPAWVKEMILPHRGDNGNGGKQESAIDKNTRAIKENTDQMKEGQYGGGARSGVPSKMNPGFGGMNWGQRDVSYGVL